MTCKRHSQNFNLTLYLFSNLKGLTDAYDLQGKMRTLFVDDARLQVLLHELHIWAYYRKFATDVVNSSTKIFQH